MFNICFNISINLHRHIHITTEKSLEKLTPKRGLLGHKEEIGQDEDFTSSPSKIL